MHPVKCSICGRLAIHYATLGANKEILCIRRGGKPGDESCMAWFAGYPYRLNDLHNKEDALARPIILAVMEEERVKMENQTKLYLEMMGKVRDSLARYGEYGLVWELDRVGMLGR